MLKAFLRDSAIYAIPSFLSRGLSIFLVPLYTRVLKPSDYGGLDMLLVFGNLVSLTVAFEVSQGVARYYSDEKNPDKKILYASTAFWFTLFCYTLFLVLSLIFTPNLAKLVMGVDGLEKIFKLGMFHLWLNGLYLLIHNQFRWELRSRNYAIASILVTLVTTSIAVTLAYGLKLGLTGILVGMIAGGLVGCMYGLWYLRDTFQFRFHMAHLKEMLAFSAPLVPSGIAVFVSLYIDRLMINHYMSLDSVGLYGIGFRLAGVVGLVMVGFQGALTPLVYAHYREEQTPNQLAKIFRIFLTFALLFFLGLSLFSREILWLMTTPPYYAAAHVVIYLVPATLLSSMYIFAPGIAIAKKTCLCLWINLGGAVLNTLFNWLLIPGFGIIGAALGKLLGYSCVFTAYMCFSQRFYHVPHDWKMLGISVTGVAVLAACGSMIDMSVVIDSALKLACLCGAGLFLSATGMVKWSEFEKAVALAKQRLERTA